MRYQDPHARRWWRLHALDSNGRHWPGIRLDLTGATLIDLDLSRCRMSDAGFNGATGLESAELGRVRVTPAATASEWQLETGTEGWRTLRLAAVPAKEDTAAGKTGWARSRRG
ncbi:hypothetical protein [Nonomuraea jabiensis]|uniref:hypothetical protein n=1 Tax=Nonomuraea jabiensis TaxID=882448 RepID=UPI0036B7598A